MKKILAMSIAFLVSSSFAKGLEGFFVGGNASLLLLNKEYTSRYYSYLINRNYESKTTTNGILFGAEGHFGYIFSDVHRVYGSVGVLSGGTGIVAGYDFTPSMRDSFRWNLGVYGGYAANGLSGGIYGAKIGALYEINQHHEINFGVKLEQTRLSGNYDKDVTTGGGLYGGYNYKF